MGTAFRYASIEADVLAMVRQYAAKKSLSAYLQEKVWQPIGAEADAAWLLDAEGCEVGHFGFNAVLRDYARFARRPISVTAICCGCFPVRGGNSRFSARTASASASIPRRSSCWCTRRSTRPTKCGACGRRWSSNSDEASEAVSSRSACGPASSGRQSRRALLPSDPERHLQQSMILMPTDTPNVEVVRNPIGRLELAKYAPPNGTASR